MVHLTPKEEDESEDGDRVSFPRWGKRDVVSRHFTEPTLEITILEILPQTIELMEKSAKINR